MPFRTNNKLYISSSSTSTPKWPPLKREYKYCEMSVPLHKPNSTTIFSRALFSRTLLKKKHPKIQNYNATQLSLLNPRWAISKKLGHSSEIPSMNLYSLFSVMSPICWPSWSTFSYKPLTLNSSVLSSATWVYKKFLTNSKFFNFQKEFSTLCCTPEWKTNKLTSNYSTTKKSHSISKSSSKTTTPWIKNSMSNSKKV